MQRLLIIPAAGLGSRLGAALPKLLVPVNGRAMIDHLLDLYAPVVSRTVIVVRPSVMTDITTHVGARSATIDLVAQANPTGMLDAILLALPVVRRLLPERVWITWCDQIAILPTTIDRVAAAETAMPLAAVVLPTCESAEPYIHFERDPTGRIVRVLHRREGDRMPPRGESDAGLFDLSAPAYLDELPRYASTPEIGARTAERNFLPFIPWIARRSPVVTVPCTVPEEAIGINDAADLARIETHLRTRTLLS